jgi:hypothetical protein
MGSATLAPMKTTSPANVVLPDSPGTVPDPPAGEVGPVFVWYLAGCGRCGSLDTPEPFRDEADRDDFALEHSQLTGHVVHLSEATGEGRDGQHTAVLIRCFGSEGWRWLCPAAGCERWNGPFVSGFGALQSWRSHAEAPC